jgi:hypothetical protein
MSGDSAELEKAEQDASLVPGFAKKEHCLAAEQPLQYQESPTRSHLPTKSADNRH